MFELIVLTLLHNLLIYLTNIFKYKHSNATNAMTNKSANNSKKKTLKKP